MAAIDVARSKWMAERMVKSYLRPCVWIFLATVMLLAAPLGGNGTQVSAAPLAAPISQCNNDTASNVGGQGLSCTVTVVNNVSSAGAPTAPSTITVTKCTGAAGPIGAGGGTCATTTSTSAQPITSVTQCDGSSNGGGGVLICTVTLTNNIAGTITATPASTYQCIGSVITGPGAPGTCTPVNTPGVTSVAAATVGQCNGSGNGGTSVGFICSVSTGSTATAALAVNVDQCNGSANGGGALVRCNATVNNVITAASTPVPATPTPVSSVAPVVTPAVTPAPTAAPVATVAPTAAPVAIVAPTAAPTPAPVVVPGLPSTSTGEDRMPLTVSGGLLLAALVALAIRQRRSVPNRD